MPYSDILGFKYSYIKKVHTLKSLVTPGPARPADEQRLVSLTFTFGYKQKELLMLVTTKFCFEDDLDLVKIRPQH